jgi:hypothetical protein
VAVGVLAPLLAVAACSADDPITAQRPTATQADTTAAPTATSTTTKKDGPAETPLKVEFKDPDLGHVIKVLRIVRHVPWPAGNPIAESTFEIIAIEVQWTAGSRYSADLSPDQLRLWTTKSTSGASATTEFGNLKGPALPLTQRAETKKGWVYYKIDLGSESQVSLHYHRPEYLVKTTNKLLPARIIRVTLVG